MFYLNKNVLRRGLFVAALALAVMPVAHASDPFLKPSKEELAMTSMPGYPGVEAVILTMDEADNDQLHVKQYYKRIKILTEKGKDLADVEIGYANFVDVDVFDAGGLEKNVTDIQARTIHSDGTIVPFTGKPYTKMLMKSAALKYQAKVFTLPDVQVGDIIEYRYAVRIADNYFEAPDWYIQGKYYVKSAHYQWYPTSLDLTGPDGASISSITWFPILPEGAKIINRELPPASATSASGGAVRVFELSVKDIPPAPQEEYMPPTASFTYQVLFNFTEYHSIDDYWKSVGKQWSKHANSFIDPNGDVRKAASDLTAGAASPEDKLRRLYAAVEAMDNTQFTRAHDKQEDKAVGLGKVSSVADVLARKRGTPDQLTELFLGMARAEGFKAYAMEVPDREHHIFVSQWLNTRQFDEMVAVVNVNGKDVFFDPGARYCPYGHLAWQHTFVTGLRQTDSGTAFGETPGDGYKYNNTARIADLKMDDQGAVTGTMILRFEGAAALHWRQRALEGDEESIKHSLRTSLEKMLPRSMEVKVDSIDNLTDYEKTLKVTYSVKGPVGTPAGKRLLVPEDLFETNAVAAFPHDKRTMAVYYHYPMQVLDAQRITLPASMSVEAAPDAAKAAFQKQAAYDLHAEAATNSITTRRTFLFGDFYVPVKDYADLRTYYAAFQASDQKKIVLKANAAVAPATAANEGGAGGN